MRIAGSNRFILNLKEKKTLTRMAKDGILIDDIEEGEISDSSSVEEITEEDFKQDARVSKPSGDARICMGDLYKYPVSSNYASGLYNLAWAQAVQNKPLDEILVRDFGFADEKSERSSSKLLVNSREDNNKSLNPSKEDCKVIIDISSDEIDSRMSDDVVHTEKEEGELEEGEIDLDSEMTETTQERVSNDNISPIASEMRSKQSEMDVEESELARQIKSIRATFNTVTVKDADKSFHSVCFQLQKSLESFHQLIMKNQFFAMDDLIQQSFTAIQVLISVFCSMNRYQQEQNKDVLSRLLVLVKSQDSAPFSSEQMREIEAMLSFLDSQALLSSSQNMNKEESWVSSGVNLNDSGALVENTAHDLNSSKKVHLEPISVKLLDFNDENMGSEASKLRLSLVSKGKGCFGPILDLHRDHDADSLPSPTRETPTPLSVRKPLVVEDRAVRPNLTTTTMAEKPQGTTMHFYETDALKAVSSYQQKFGRTSYLSSNKLPSPTPSEEHNDGDGDTNEEVSSHSTVENIRTLNTPSPSQPIGSATPTTDSLRVQGLVPDKNVGQAGSMLNPILKASAKSRDPRLRYGNPETVTLDLNQRPRSVESNAPKTDILGGITSSRKHKILEESILDDHTLKRQRNGLTYSGACRDVQLVSGSGGWLEDSVTAVSQFTERNHLIENMRADPAKLENGRTVSGKGPETGNGTGNFNVAFGGIKQLPVTGTSITLSLPPLLKDIAVNPTMLMSLIKREQQKLSAEVQKKPGDLVRNMMHSSSMNAVSGTVPSVNVLSSNSSELERKHDGKPQVPAQTVSTNQQSELGNIRMKPRDPRRVLHNSTLQKSNSLRSGQSKTNEAPPSITQGSKDNLVVRQQGEQAETNSMPSQSTSPPDISRQFTKELKNLADLLSASQATDTPPIVPQVVSSQPVPLKTDKADAKVVAKDFNDQRSGSDFTPEEGAGNPSHPQNVWRDVEHLFEGYDDQEKAAIQRERARRIEEQNKMFAVRKLCLVLDLDHTLLNSAKFIEVDPVHDEILRKKEEQDCEKPQRHLFRFPHMGMWTKLRPGIWNFLEKASKLYELHLYTMGNKLYATEMAKVLDPTGMLFAGRVISKGDDGDPFDSDERVPKSKDLDGVLGLESSVVIIDDSVRVWPHNKLNLIVLERYTYFPCSRRQFGLPGPSLLEIDHDERPEDGTLASALSVIERMHQIFFSHRSLDDVDVRNILASEQRKILGGCRIVFSRVFPVGLANPHLHPLWQTAEQFGAVCTNQIDEHVTHVVANSLGTDKVNWALTTGRFVVHPGWVEASALLYRKANEHDFAVKL